MNRSRTLLAIGALAASTALAAGCGGDDGGDEDPAEILRAAFSEQSEFRSGVINLGLNGSLAGETSGSIDAQVSGPFSAQEGEQAELALDATADLSVEGLPQLPGGSFSFDFDGGLAIADGSLYVTSEDTTYEASERLYSQISPLLEVAEGSGDDEATEEDSEAAAEGGDEIVDALTNLENEGTEDVEGESTIHVSGDFDFESLQEELGEGAPAEVAGIFDSLDGSLDVFVAEDDMSPRRFDFSFAISDPPEELAAAGFEGAELTLSIGLSEPNTEQTIEAPSGETEPLDDLLAQFDLSESDLLDALQGGLPGGGLGSGDIEIPDVEGGGSGAAATDPDVQECIASAETPEEITDCLDQ